MMIDYDKLKIAHELADKWSKDNGLLMEVICLYGATRNAYELHYSGNEICISELCDLIAKLQSLVKPEPKYKIGTEVFVLMGDEIRSFEIHEIIEDGEYWYLNYIDSGCMSHDGRDFDQYREDILFPTRQALIESQLQYWSKLLQDECKHPNKYLQPDGKFDCDDCGMVGMKIDTQSNQPQVDVESHISALQSEINDLKWSMNEVCNILSLKEKNGWTQDDIRSNQCEYDKR